MSERKLTQWQAAGLIDAETAANIRQWEDSHARPWGVWALIGLGALAIGLGLVSVIAANWDEIPGEIRIAIHFVIMAALAAFIWWQARRETSLNHWFDDAKLFVLGALGLTFFGHIGQVYQTSSPLWQPLLAWLFLFTPILLGFGRGWLVALAWFGVVIATAWNHASSAVEMIGLIFDGREEVKRSPLYWGLIATPPMVISAFAAFMRGHTLRPDFWRGLEQIAFLTILVGVSSFIIADAGFADGLGYHVVAILLCAGVTWFVRKTKSGQATAGILLVTAVAYLLSAPIIGYGFAASIFKAVLFMTIWGAVAYGAIHAGWRIIFQMAIGVLAVRLIILSAELGDDLLSSGVGLIIIGLITLGIAWAAIRISRRYAPKKEVAA
jgi:uncharacterized membrane protein